MTIYYDVDGDSVIDARVDYTYDSDATYEIDGHWLTETTDWWLDGIIDILYTATRDADGNWLTIEKDEYADGIIETRRTARYSIDGNQLGWTEDTDGDGIDDETMDSTCVGPMDEALVEDFMSVMTWE